MSKISVVIPNYNGVHLLKKHLPAVLDSLREGDEVVIADDSSTDMSVGYLVEKFTLKKDSDTHLYTGNLSEEKRVKMVVVSTSKNMRFAGTVNLGVQVATGDYIFLLNNDVSPKEDVLEYLNCSLPSNTGFLASTSGPTCITRSAETTGCVVVLS